MRVIEESWLENQFRVSARRLVETDPALLGPVGRELRGYAMERLGDRRRHHLRLIATTRAEQP